VAWTPPSHWVETESQLKKSGQVTLDANGLGTLTFDPSSARQRWLVTSVVVTTNQSSTSTEVPIVTLGLNSTALNTMSPGNQRGSTWSGNQDTFTGEVEVSSCDFLSVMFSPPPQQSGTPIAGVICTAVVTGSIYTRRA
jgi:hypothetical protein